MDVAARGFNYACWDSAENNPEVSYHMNTERFETERFEPASKQELYNVELQMWKRKPHDVISE